MSAVLPFLQAAVGVCLVVYAVVVAAKRLRVVLPMRPAGRAPVDDLRLVIDLAARLRDAKKTEAVIVCQKLIDELLKPAEPKA